MANDDIMIRIANALEKAETIQLNSQQQTKQTQKYWQDLLGVIDKGFQNQKPPANTVDAKQLASLLLPHLLQGFDDKKIRVAGQELINQIREERQRIPNSIAVKGELWGFTSWKPLVAFSVLLLLCSLLCAGFYYQSQDTYLYRQGMQMKRERDFYRSQISKYKAGNRTYAHLFPDYDDLGFWSNAENQPPAKTP